MSSNDVGWRRRGSLVEMLVTKERQDNMGASSLIFLFSRKKKNFFFSLGLVSLIIFSAFLSFTPARTILEQSYSLFPSISSHASSSWLPIPKTPPSLLFAALFQSNFLIFSSISLNFVHLCLYTHICVWEYVFVYVKLKMIYISVNSSILLSATIILLQF